MLLYYLPLANLKIARGIADMVELVDMLVLGTSEVIRGGSNPSIRIY